MFKFEELRKKVGHLTGTYSDVYKAFSERILDETVNSTHIEGNMLKQSDTIALLNNDIGSVESTNVKDIAEVQGYINALRYMLDAANNSTPLTIELIIKLHQYEMELVNFSEAGVLRSQVGDNVAISNHPNIHLVRGEYVTSELESLLDWYRDLDEVTLDDIAVFKVEFIRIHPFRDGNGRLSRLLLNFLLLSNNFYPIVIHYKERDKYIQALNDSMVNHNLDIFVEYIYQEYITQLELYLASASTL